MTPTPSALDPVSGLTIGPMDQHFNVVNIYYELLPGYQKELNDAATAYQRAWHDYAVLLLNTAEFMNIKTRPPGFKAAPMPPTVHMLNLDNNYKLITKEIPVAKVPPDPDPAKQTLQPVPGNAFEWNIVDITPAGTGSGGIMVPTAPLTITMDMAVKYLKTLSQGDFNSVINQVLMK